jgi:hypothetical protein
MHEVNGDRPRLESTPKMWSVPVNLVVCPLFPRDRPRLDKGARATALTFI